MAAIILFSTIGMALGLLFEILSDHRGGDDSTRGRQRPRPLPVPVEAEREILGRPR